MSRFSKAAAEKLGWAFTHESPEIELADSGPTGVTRTIPAKVTAEKFLSLPGREGHTVTETAETLGLLLERIHLFEQHLEARGLASGAPELTEKESLKRSEEAARVAGAEEELQIGEGHEAPKRRKGLRRRRSAK
jgi:hypothetical protein